MSLPIPAMSGEQVLPERAARLRRRRIIRGLVALVVASVFGLGMLVQTADAAQASQRKVERQHGQKAKRSCRCKPKVDKHRKHRKEQADHGKRGQWKKHKRHGRKQVRWHKRHGSRWHKRHQRRQVDNCQGRDGGGRVCKRVCKPKRHVAPPVKRHKRIRWHHKHPKPRVIVDKPGFRDQPKPKPVQPKPVKAPTVILSPPVSKTAPKRPVVQPAAPEQTANVLPFTGPRDFLLPAGLGLVLLGAITLLAGSFKHNDRPVG